MACAHQEFPIAQRAGKGKRSVRTETARAIGEIERADLFMHVGEPYSQEFLVVTSWLDAAECCDELEFENYLLDISNALSEQVARVAPERFDSSWNEVVDEIRPQLESKVTRAMQLLHVPADCVKPVRNTTRWCLLKYCMECEYRDVVQIDHYHKIWEIFKAGHFPCGVERQKGKDTLMVF